MKLQIYRTQIKRISELRQKWALNYVILNKKSSHRSLMELYSPTIRPIEENCVATRIIIVTLNLTLLGQS
jgi:hypothetical protein